MLRMKVEKNLTHANMKKNVEMFWRNKFGSLSLVKYMVVMPGLINKNIIFRSIS